METAILTWIHAWSSPVLDGVFRVSHELGTLRFCAALIGVLVLWHLARGERREALAWIALGLAASWLPELLKAVTTRPRPALWPPLVAASRHSFPSGHATAGAALYPLLAWIAVRSWPAWGPAAWTAGLAVGVFIGLGRLYLGVHWPSDVLAGWVLGIALGGAVVWWLRQPTRTSKQPPPDDGAPAPDAGSDAGLR